MLSEAQRATLTAVCDTVVPSIDAPHDADGFFARRSSDTGAPVAVAEAIEALPAEQQAGMALLLDALAEQGYAAASQPSREQLLRNVAMSGPDGAIGTQALTGLALFFTYGLPGADGTNPNWIRFGYPGPLSPPPQVAKAIETLAPDGDVELDCDVCVVGSGAGGSVIAAELAARGLDVVVLEAGGYVDDAEFLQLELPAYANSFWRGGPTFTADMNVSLQAGAGLGGGTVINWTNSLRTKSWVREQWEQEYGLEGLAAPDFDAHLDAVWERLGVNRECSELNGPQQRMQAGAQALGWSFTQTDRNADPERYDFDSAGYLGFGDQSGSKRSTTKTFLKDAFDAGARILTRCRAERITTAGGRATGVLAAWQDPATGAGGAVTVNAPRVVVACGALESPALLLRSQIGGECVGRYLRLHPCTAMIGLYGEDLQGWRGAPHAGLVNEFANLEDGYGFLIEGAQYTTALGSSAIPFVSARQHKELMSRFAGAATFIGLLRDHGHGSVTTDASGEAVPWYSLSDERDVRITKQSIAAQVRLHEAAGAVQIMALAAGAPTWRAGEDLDAFINRICALPLRAGGWKIFAAHQMGTCRMGSDPATSVADPWGQLHDTNGVWVGDASAFPTPSGTNPMITIMALAHRTVQALAADAASTVRAAAQA
ncbi:MAG TPA: GMC family oxidoreductase [Solirubrobacteraceae bacterium]|nr:GMC family oxidoreductase [Solirubrobacteraceae bacterium]